jgi:hypothetical protein
MGKHVHTNANLIQGQLPEYTPEANEEVYGTFSAEKIIVVTKMLGRTWGAQALTLVPETAVYACSRCGELLSRVTIADLTYEAEVERGWCEQYLLNLLTEHSHSPEPDTAP